MKKKDDAMTVPFQAPSPSLRSGSVDAKAIRTFFSAAFGWTVHDDAWLQTPTIKAGVHGHDPAPQIYANFHASDLEGAARAVRADGGKADDIFEEPGFGRLVNCRGPGGLRFGLHQMAPQD